MPTKPFTDEQVRAMGMDPETGGKLKSLIEAVETDSPSVSDSPEDSKRGRGRPRALSSDIVTALDIVVLSPDIRGRQFLVWEGFGQSISECRGFATKKEACKFAELLIQDRRRIDFPDDPQGNLVWFPAPMQLFRRTVLHCVVCFPAEDQ